MFRTSRTPSRRSAPAESRWQVLALGARNTELPSAAAPQRTQSRKSPSDVIARIRDSEVFLLVEAGGEPPLARIVRIDAASYVLVFETESQLEALAGPDAERAVVPMQGFLDYLSGRKVGLAINIGDRATSAVISAEELAALTVPREPPPVRAQPVPVEAVARDVPREMPAEVPPPPATPRQSAEFSALLAPREFPDSVLDVLADRLSDMSAMCRRCLLFRAHYDDGQVGYLLGLSGVVAGDKPAFERTVSEALGRSRRPDLRLDIAFLEEEDPVLDRLSLVGLDMFGGATRR